MWIFLEFSLDFSNTKALGSNENYLLVKNVRFDGNFQDLIVEKLIENLNQ